MLLAFIYGDDTDTTIQASVTTLQLGLNKSKQMSVSKLYTYG